MILSDNKEDQEYTAWLLDFYEYLESKKHFKNFKPLKQLKEQENKINNRERNPEDNHF